jgi:hypothetical protein
LRSPLRSNPSLEREVDENNSEDYAMAITGKGFFFISLFRAFQPECVLFGWADEVRAFDISLRSIALSEIDSDARTQSKGHTFVGAELALEH